MDDSPKDPRTAGLPMSCHKLGRKQIKNGYAAKFGVALGATLMLLVSTSAVGGGKGAQKV